MGYLLSTKEYKRKRGRVVRVPQGSYSVAAATYTLPRTASPSSSPVYWPDSQYTRGSWGISPRLGGGVMVTHARAYTVTSTSSPGKASPASPTKRYVTRGASQATAAGAAAITAIVAAVRRAFFIFRPFFPGHTGCVFIIT